MNVHHTNGFTLIELIVVLAIAGLIMVVTPPLLSSAMPGLQLKSTARQVAAGLRFARGRAVAQRTEAVLTLDLEARSVSISGRESALSIPDDLDIELVGSAAELEDENLGRIRFFPDGTSTGGRITLGYRGNGYDLDVDWLTGRVSIAAAEIPEG